MRFPLEPCGKFVQAQNVNRAVCTRCAFPKNKHSNVALGLKRPGAKVEDSK